MLLLPLNPTISSSIDIYPTVRAYSFIQLFFTVSKRALKYEACHSLGLPCYHFGIDGDKCFQPNLREQEVEVKLGDDLSRVCLQKMVAHICPLGLVWFENSKIVPLVR